MWSYNQTSELYHHGIKGQKWGIRKYQNEDGSLTEAGKKRYNTGSLHNKLTGIGYRRFAKDSEKALNKYERASKESLADYKVSLDKTNKIKSTLDKKLLKGKNTNRIAEKFKKSANETLALEKAYNKGKKELNNLMETLKNQGSNITVLRDRGKAALSKNTKINSYLTGILTGGFGSAIATASGIQANRNNMQYTDKYKVDKIRNSKTRGTVRFID